MDNFKRRCVQDLAWVIHSPPLISGNIAGVNWWNSALFQHEYEACLPALQQLDIEPAPLLEAIAAAKSQRLGHYFEVLVAYWFTLSPNYELLLANHQLRTPEKTLGELDFLLRKNDSGKVIHLEVSVKFYLGAGDLNNMANWHGPGLKDRLDRKFEHLCTHQTQLARKYPELMPHAVDEAACLVKGRLFYPADAEPQTGFTARGHLFGRWYELPDLPTDNKTHPDTPLPKEETYICLGKNRWLAEVADSDRTELTALPTSINEAVLYAKTKTTSFTEEQRFFLLPKGFWQQI